MSACWSSDTPDGGIGGLLTAFRPVSRDSQPPAPGGGKRQGARGGRNWGLLRDGQRLGIGRPPCLGYRLCDLLDDKLMERRSSGRYDIEPSAALRASKLNVAKHA